MLQSFTPSRTHLGDSGDDSRKYRRDYEQRLLIYVPRGVLVAGCTVHALVVARFIVTLPMGRI